VVKDVRQWQVDAKDEDQDWEVVPKSCVLSVTVVNLVAKETV